MVYQASAGRSRNDGQSKTVTTASPFVSLIKERTLAQAANLESKSGAGPHESAKKNRSIWILNPAADLTLIIGAPLLIFIGIMAAKGIWSSATITSFIMIWAIGHHLPGMMRAYGDPELFRRFWVRLILAPLFLLAVCIFAFWTTVNSGLIAIAAIWGWWHYLMQAYGFVRIYDSKAGSFAATTRWLDQGMCLTWFAAAVVLEVGKVGHPRRPLGLEAKKAEKLKNQRNTDFLINLQNEGGFEKFAGWRRRKGPRKTGDFGGLAP